MEPNERKAKEKELYELMELDVMRNSEEMRGFLANLYSKTNPGEECKSLIDAVYPKVMTNQEITDELLGKLSEGSENPQEMTEKLRQAIDFIRKYQKGELDLGQSEEQENTEDNEL